jgi:hypothetical protein
MSLVVAADAAYPFDLDLLPAGCDVVLGYLGGATPHVWTPDEVKHVTDTGRTWCAIWTAPNPSVRLTVVDAARDVQDFRAALIAHGYSRNLPVFWDVEYSTWQATGANFPTVADAWRAGMHNGGYPRAYIYAPWAAGTEWGAQWVNYRPMSLPAGRVGWQYANALAGDSFDLSVFDSTIFGVDMPAQVNDPGIQAVLTALGAVYGDPAHPFSLENLKSGENTIITQIKALSDAVTALTATVGQLAAKVNAGGLTGQPAATADQLVASAVSWIKTHG